VTGTSAKRKDYFAQQSAVAAFDRMVAKHVSDILKAIVSQFMPPENTQRLRHGGDWRHPGLPGAIGSGMQLHTSEVMINYEDVVNHDLRAIDRYAQKIAVDMSRQFRQMMYATVSAACDQTGNVVDAKAAGGPLEAFATMLEKIQFRADRYGHVTLPQMHLSPELMEKLREAENAAPPELLQRINDTRERKTVEAIEAESIRKARFVRYGEDS
jgi:hypothetical protein